MKAIISLLPDDFVVVSFPDMEGYKGRGVGAQGKGRFDPTTKTVFFDFHKKLIPFPIMGEIEVRNLT